MDLFQTLFTPDDGLSYVGRAAYQSLKTTFYFHRKHTWNKTAGKVQGLYQTPPQPWEMKPGTNHSAYLTEKMLDVISRAEKFVDVTSLGPPDGEFLASMQNALLKAAVNASVRNEPVVVRFIFGNIVGMPLNCKSIAYELTKDWCDGYQNSIKVYVGAFRKGLTWNHSKIIAVDSEYLFTGGHNLWDQHYLQYNPVHDLSFELSGKIAEEGHAFAEAMWRYIIRKEKTKKFMRFVPTCIPCATRSRVGLGHWPSGIDKYPPSYSRPKQPWMNFGPSAMMNAPDDLTLISLGRLGNCPLTDKVFSLGRTQSNVADIGIAAMLKAATKSIKMSLQDLGPLAVPYPGRGVVSIPGGEWPMSYLSAIAHAIWNNEDLQVEIVLSNPNAVPSNVSPLVANYGNGWSREQVCRKIVKAIRAERTEASTRELQQCVQRVRVAFIRLATADGKWEDGAKIGNHAKFFCIDDLCYYIGSQNLYIANLAEWGVVVDSETATQNMLGEYWTHLWDESFDERTAVDMREILEHVLKRAHKAEEEEDPSDIPPLPVGTFFPTQTLPDIVDLALAH